MKKRDCSENEHDSHCVHNGVKASWANVLGKLTKLFEIKNGMKQEHIPVSTLFTPYFMIVGYMAFKKRDYGVYIRYHTTGNLFNIRRMSAKTMVSVNLSGDFVSA